jgi:hypothetical protein
VSDELGLPPWEAVRELLMAPKPALTCTVYGLGKPYPVRVAYDGDGVWTLDDGHGGSVTSLAWARSALEPERYANLTRAGGSVLRREREGGRDLLVVDIEGLRREGGAALRAWVDEATGAIVRMERLNDPAPLVLVPDLREDGRPGQANSAEHEPEQRPRAEHRGRRTHDQPQHGAGEGSDGRGGAARDRAAGRQAAPSGHHRDHRETHDEGDRSPVRGDGRNHQQHDRDQHDA